MIMPGNSISPRDSGSYGVRDLGGQLGSAVLPLAALCPYRHRIVAHSRDHPASDIVSPQGRETSSHKAASQCDLCHSTQWTPSLLMGGGSTPPLALSGVSATPAYITRSTWRLKRAAADKRRKRTKKTNYGS
jgi:hypothetical protein